MELEEEGWQHSTILSIGESVYFDVTHLVMSFY